MSMPKHPASYEQQYHLLLELLSQPTTKEDVRISRENEKEAEKFRLRFYAFQRTVLSDAETRLDKAIAKGYSTELQHQIQQTMEKVMRAKRFSVHLEQDEEHPSKWNVVFKDRDIKDEALSQQLMELLNFNNPTLPDSPLTFNPQSTSEAVYQDYFETKAKVQQTEVRIQENSSTNDGLESEKDTMLKQDEERQLKNLIQRTIVRIQHGQDASFHIPFESLQERKDFIAALQTATSSIPAFPSYTAETELKNVRITKTPIDNL